MHTQKEIDIRDLRKSFLRLSTEQVVAVDGINLRISAGELLVLLGPSGCGKTTLLRCIAGLEHPTGGEIRIGTKVVYSAKEGIDIRANRRDVPMIFQNYALWPHMTIADNVGYPLESRGTRSKAEVRAKVVEVLKLVGLATLANEYPGTISGGQQQRVSLARALVTDPDIILFDEPLSNIDAQVRNQLRLEIKNMHRRVGFAAVYVTHDQEEALALATRIAIMDRGRVVQVGTPHEIYDRPATKYVAEFVGRANTLPCRVRSKNQEIMVIECALGTMSLPAANCPPDARPDQELILIVRPEDITIDTAAAIPNKERHQVAAKVEAVEFFGAKYDVIVTVNGAHLRVIQGKNEQPATLGQQVTLSFNPMLVRATSS